MTDDPLAAARAALGAGHAGRAAALAAAALADAPDDIDLLEVAALAAAAEGRAATAEAGWRRIVALRPAARWAWDDLARALIGRGERPAAEAVLAEALAADPGHADAHLLLGILLAEREELVAAAWHLERAVALAGPRAELLADLGRVRLRLGEPAAAGALATRAAAAAPTLLSPAILGADAAERAGDHAAADLWLDRAEPLARAAGRDVGLARAIVRAHGPDWHRTLADLDAAPSLAGAALLLRGRLRDRAGRPAEAWADWMAGKRALARPHDRAAVAARAGALAALRPVDVPPAGVRRDVPQPVFVLGAPRSGTTLVEALLAAHPRVRAAGELPFADDMRGLAETLLGGPFPAGYARLAAADRHHLPALFRDLYLARAERAGLLAPGADLFTDKMPLNEWWLPLLRLAFPEAPMLLVRRDPRDVLVSMMAHDLTHGWHAAYDPGDAAHLLAATGRLVAAYGDRWGRPPMVVGYEALVARPDEGLAMVMAAVGLPVDPAQHRPAATGRSTTTPSYAAVREAPHGRAVGRWRAHAAALAPLLPILAPLAAAGGYAD